MITLDEVTMTKKAKHVDHLPWGLQYKSHSAILTRVIVSRLSYFEQIGYRRLDK